MTETIQNIPFDKLGAIGVLIFLVVAMSLVAICYVVRTMSNSKKKE